MVCAGRNDKRTLGNGCENVRAGRATVNAVAAGAFPTKVVVTSVAQGRELSQVAQIGLTLIQACPIVLGLTIVLQKIAILGDGVFCRVNYVRCPMARPSHSTPHAEVASTSSTNVV